MRLGETKNNYLLNSTWYRWLNMNCLICWAIFEKKKIKMKRLFFWDKYANSYSLLNARDLPSIGYLRKRAFHSHHAFSTRHKRLWFDRKFICCAWRQKKKKKKHKLIKYIKHAVCKSHYHSVVYEQQFINKFNFLIVSCKNNNNDVYDRGTRFR